MMMQGVVTAQVLDEQPPVNNRKLVATILTPWVDSTLNSTFDIMTRDVYKSEVISKPAGFLDRHIERADQDSCGL
jgi:hypothetical protein